MLLTPFCRKNRNMKIIILQFTLIHGQENVICTAGLQRWISHHSLLLRSLQSTGGNNISTLNHDPRDNHGKCYQIHVIDTCANVSLQDRILPEIGRIGRLWTFLSLPDIIKLFSTGFLKNKSYSDHYRLRAPFALWDYQTWYG